MGKYGGKTGFSPELEKVNYFTKQFVISFAIITNLFVEELVTW